jgi:hypothetical protein
LTLAALLLPAPAAAEVCETLRPFWDPATGPATVWDETLHLAASPISVVLLVATLAAARFRSAWGGLAAICGWSAMVGFLVFGTSTDPESPRMLGMTEGCIGSPALFIGLVTAICLATFLYTAPSGARSTDQE